MHWNHRIISKSVILIQKMDEFHFVCCHLSVCLVSSFEKRVSGTNRLTKCTLPIKLGFFSRKQLGLGTTRNWSLIVSIRESATKIAWSVARRRLSRLRKPSRSSLARILRVKGLASIRENAFNRYTRPRARSNELSFFPFGFWVHMTDELFDSFLTVITHFPFSGTSCSVERWHFSFFADRVRIIATFR